MPVRERCANHPDVPADRNCKKCGKPICQACFMQTQIGVFCSMTCAEEAEKFQDKVGSATPVYASGMNWGKLFQRLVLLAIVCAVFYGIMYAMSGQTDPREMVAGLLDQIKSLIDIF
jgi:hypothetical protein